MWHDMLYMIGREWLLNINQLLNIINIYLWYFIQKNYNYSSLNNNIFKFLKAGVRKGDVVALYMPVCPLAVAGMLAAARIGIPCVLIYNFLGLHRILNWPDINFLQFQNKWNIYFYLCVFCFAPNNNAHCSSSHSYFLCILYNRISGIQPAGYPVSSQPGIQQVKPDIRPDTGYKKRLNIRPDIRLAGYPVQP